MKVFISWSGDLSKEIALIFYDWLPRVIQQIRPFVSPNIEKGKVGTDEIYQALSDAKVGIFCMTQDNKDSKWIHFEAGAISNLPNSSLMTFLFNVDHVDIGLPLSMYQATIFQKTEVYQLLSALNSKLFDENFTPLTEGILRDSFEKNWSDFEGKILKLNSLNPLNKGKREDRELLEESLLLLRSLDRKISQGNLNDKSRGQLYPTGISIPIKLIITNVKIINFNEMEFDINLRNESDYQIELAGMQFGIFINDGIELSQDSKIIIESGSSHLGNKMQIPKVSKLDLNSRQIRIAGAPLPGAGNGSLFPPSETSYGHTLFKVRVVNLKIIQQIEPMLDLNMDQLGPNISRSAITIYKNDRMCVPVNLHFNDGIYRNIIVRNS